MSYKHLGTLVISLLILPAAAMSAEWSSWTTSDCYKGIDVRYKDLGYNSYAEKTKIAIQFRNRYNEKVHMRYYLADASSSKEDWHGGTATQGDTTGTWFLLRNPTTANYFLEIANAKSRRDKWSCDNS